MSPRAVGTLVLVLAVALAGCSGFGADLGEPVTTAEPTDAPPTVPAPTLPSPPLPTVESVSSYTHGNRSSDPNLLAPGVNRSGVVNASALIQAHLAALNETGYAFRLGRIDRYEPGSSTAGEAFTSRQFRTVTAAAGLDEARFRFVSVQVVQERPSTRRSTYWGNRSVVFVRTRRANETSYFTRQLESSSWPKRAVNGIQRYVLEDVLTRFNYTVSTLYTPTGTYIRLTAVSLAGPASGPVVTAFDATIVLDERGRIYRVDSRVVITSGDGGKSIDELHYRLRRIGVASIPLPEWVDEARTATEVDD